MPNPVPPLIEAFLPVDASDFDQSFAGVQTANALFEAPLNFYGGYIMMAMHKKKDILKDRLCKRLCAKIAELEGEIVKKDEEREAINNVAILNFDLAQKDADRIKGQAEKIKELNRVIELNKRLVRKEKN